MLTRRYTRRSFVRSTSLLSLSPLVPSMFCRAGRAADTHSNNSDSRVLVVIQLDGGNDGINTVVPYGDDGYGRARKTLQLKTTDLYKLDDHVGLHPQMRAAKELFDDGRLAIVQGVGYPNPDRSHFRSMRIWQTARFEDEAHDTYGWLGRALDADIARSADDAGAFYVGEDAAPVALWGRRSTTVGLSSLEDLSLSSNLWLPLPSDSRTTRASGVSLREFVTGQVPAAYANARRLEEHTSASTAGAAAAYPDTELGRRLRLVAQLLRSGARARVFYTTQTGYDTHAAQLYVHGQLLREFSQALKAFLDDLRAGGLDQRVIVLVFSEFGRRVQENESQGTDHGTAGPVFLAGQSLQGGLVGRGPSLTDLDSGDLKLQIGFQRVYATLLDRWLGLPAQQVLGQSFEPLPVFGT